MAREMEFRFMRLGMACKAITDYPYDSVNRVKSDPTVSGYWHFHIWRDQNYHAAIQNAKSRRKTVLVTSNNIKTFEAQCDELVLVASSEYSGTGQ